MKRAFRLALLFVLGFLFDWWWRRYLSIGGLSPDWLLVATVALSGLQGPVYGQSFGFPWGLGLDTLAVRLFGGRALLFTLTGFIVGSARRQTDLSGPGSQFVMMALITVAYALALGVVGAVFGPGFLWPGWKAFLFLPLFNAAAAPFVFIVVERVLARK